jgi:hypothetical protein
MPATASADAVLASQAKPIQNPTTDYGLDHDRVQMLSLNSDGSVAQYHPEVIGNYATTVSALNSRFAQQKAGVSGGALSAMEAKQATVLADLAVTEGQ